MDKIQGNPEILDRFLGRSELKPVWRKGRPTYKQTGADYCLLVAEGWQHWVVVHFDFLNTKKAFNQSNEGSLNPETTGDWRVCRNLEEGCSEERDNSSSEEFWYVDAGFEVNCMD